MAALPQPARVPRGSALEPLTDTSFALPGGSARFDLEGIRRLLD